MTTKHAHPKRCTSCDEIIKHECPLFEGLCAPCGREHATDDPSSLGPDA